MLTSARQAARRLQQRKNHREIARDALAHGKGEAGHAARWDNYDTAWDYVTDPGREGAKYPVIFDHVEVAEDGGLSEIGEKPELWYNTRPLTGLAILAFAVVNPILLVRSDLTVLTERFLEGNEEDWSHCYLMTTQLLKFLSRGSVDWSSFSVQVVLIFELVWVCGLFGHVVLNLLRMLLFSKFRRWHAFARLFFELLVTAASFSGMKILFYVAPQVLSRDLCYALFYRDVHRKRWVVWTVVSRFICLLIGMDIFLVKFRMVAGNVMKDDFSIEYLLYAFIFLNQVLNAVEISWIIRERLFRFVFGGEDGIMTRREVVRMEVWNARVAQLIVQKYPLWKALSILATWCDDDFQLLILDEPGALTQRSERPQDKESTSVSPCPFTDSVASV